MITNKIRLVELFSGIGTQRAALERAGVPYESVACCEIDPYAYGSYCAIHGNTSNLGDITKVEHLPDCDLLTYSFPCQSISLAGKKEGFEKGSGTSSALLWEVQRLLDDMHKRGTLPRILLMENVFAITNKRNIGNFNKWINWLSSIGYTNSYKCLNTKNFNIPQNRNRCYMISCLGGRHFKFPEGKPKTRHLKDLLEPKVDEKYYLSPERIAKLVAHKEHHQALGHGFGFSITDTSGNAKCIKSHYREEEDTLILIRNNTAKGYIEAHDGDGLILDQPTSKTKRGRVQDGISPTVMTSGQIGTVEDMCIRRLTPRECWRLMDLTDDEFNKAASAVCHGRKMSDSQLYKQAGNAICVGVLAEIFKSLFN